jgi:hypothetical protein
MVDDGRLKADVTLENLTMEDRRQGVQTSKLMDKRHDPSSLTIDHFISLRYDQDAENRRSLYYLPFLPKYSNVNLVDISISRFYLILAPEFLGVLVGLFSFLSATEDSEDQSNIPSISTSSLPKTKQLQTPSTADNASLAALPVAQAVVEAPPKIELNCNLSEIEVILLENSLKPDDSQALIMSFNAFAKGITKDDVFKLKGALKDLQVTSTYFNHEKRHLSSYRVLQKFNVELTGSMNQITNAQNFDVTPENVYIALSPAVVRLMSAVSAQFSEHQGKLNVKPVEVALKRYVDYWNSKQIEKVNVKFELQLLLK